ncbi:MAG TPA: EAL domain-containing protein [Noviherbaspirillum sp.]|uniref:putative bifunctional diguanylate cyclase/phosphodiesterase n=1 Tax=Noviherbaspirillum sp. TaxID=1926288 RepID=UPI002F9552BA
MHPPSRTSHRYHAFARATAIALAAGALLVLAAWAVPIPSLAAALPPWLRVESAVALGLLLASFALLPSAAGPPQGLHRAAAHLSAAAVIALGAASLYEYLAGHDTGVSRILLTDGGRMSMISAAVFVLLGIALVLRIENARPRATELLTLVAALNAFVPAIGYLYGKSALYEIPYYGMIGLPVTLAFLLLCAAILAARPECGAMRLLTNESAGGITARRLLPAALLLPVLMERVQFWGFQAGYYDITFGMISITLSSMLVFGVLIAWTARLLLRLDEQRAEAGEALHETLDVLESNLNALSATNARLQAEASERRAAEESLFHEHERAEVTLNSIGDGVITTDVDGRIVYMNPAAENMSGWKLAEAGGMPIHEVFRIVDPITREAVVPSVGGTLAEDRVTHLPANAILIHRDGSESAVNDSCAPIHGRDGRVMGAVLVFHDVSAMRAMSQRMSWLAQHDALTDLPNRFLLQDRLAQAIALALKHRTRTAALFLDLDRFKHVNDTLGHFIGDRLLIEIAARLKRLVRDPDTVARHGGDEFVVLMQEASDGYQAARTASQVLAALTEPYLIEGHEIHMTCSIGISMCPEDGEDADTIIKHAEAAMYQAKAQGRNNYQFFMRRINERAIKRFALEGSLRRAIAREESALYFQPKMDIASRQVVGAEALLRWHDRNSGPVSPAQFIPIAEESGLIIQMGEWVLRKACAQNRKWQDAGYRPMPVAVNVSAVQFRDKQFLDLVARVLHETRLPAHFLELEVTESVTMYDLELTVAVLEALKDMGVGLSIDDFGTGYSSLSYLKRFPIDTLKIDRSFVQDVTTDADSAAITRAIISMARSMNHKVIAEGVETEEQFAFLRDEGCDQVQGFFVDRPLTSTEFEQKILLPGAAAVSFTAAPAPTGARQP